MRKPAPLERGKRALKQTISVLRTVPAPVGGWNARDPLASMAPQDAVELVNFFPRAGDCVVRGGSMNFATGMTTQVGALMAYTPPTGTNKLFGATASNIYDVTSSGAVGAAVAACTSRAWQHSQIGVSGGHYLACVNGTDSMLYYDGTSWITINDISTPAITGAVTSNFINVNTYKRRLFFIEKNKLSFWYLGIDSVGGAVTEFLLGPVAPLGGYCMAMGTWSLDGGNGPADYAVFVTSEGQAVVFTGSDPSDATKWSLIGTFFVGRPIGRRCLKKYGGDLLVLTENGVFPLSLALRAASIDRKQALTNKIDTAFTTAARSTFSTFGWDLTLLPSQAALICNVPNGVGFDQYVMNTITKAWCKFTGWAAECFIEFNRELYFGGVGTTVKAWTGKSDVGTTNISATAKTAYSYFNDRQYEKQFKLAWPTVLVDGPFNYSLGLSIDFRQEAALGTASYSASSGAQWDVAQWDVDMWAAGLEVVQQQQTVAAWEGYCAAMLLRVDTNSLEVQWVASNYVYERGGLVG